MRFASRYDDGPFRGPVVDPELVSKHDGRLASRDRDRRQHREETVGERRGLRRGGDPIRESAIDTDTSLVGGATVERPPSRASHQRSTAERAGRE